MNYFRVLSTCCVVLTINLSSFEDPSVDETQLKNLWYTNIPKQGRYYQFTLNDTYFRGTRAWDERWEIISNATSLEGKRVLELGSNLGICSTFLMKYAPVKSVTALENNPQLVKMCKEIQKIFGVSYPVHQLNLNKPFEGTLGYDYDLVICMSVYNWVNNKERLMNFLSRFPEVLYEGHDSEEVEVARFARVRITNYEFLGYGKKKRPIFLFKKD